VFATGALLITDARIRMPSLSPFEQRARIERGVFRLKVQPRGIGADARLLLSTWMLEPRDANVEAIEYTVEARDGDGVWRELQREIVGTGAHDRRRGAPFVLPQAKWGKAQGLRVSVRYGDLPLGDLAKTAEIRWLASHAYPEFAPALTSAIDLAPAR
jgi:hypothetical protein